MTVNEFIQDLTEFCQIVVPQILANLQEQRFKNQGQFNDNPRWQDNDDRVVDDKGFNAPLYDTGELYQQLTNPSNWKIKARSSNSKIIVEVPDEEDFTPSKYDVLDEGGYVAPWHGHSGNIEPPIKSVPARPFKKISAQDVQWIRDQLVKAIQERYGAA